MAKAPTRADKLEELAADAKEDSQFGAMCLKRALEAEAALETVEPATDAEPLCWLPTATAKWLEEYDGPACGTETVAYNQPLKSDGGVPLFTRPPESRLREADIGDILLPLEDIHSDRGQCEWHDVAKAIDETRRRLRAALAQEDGQ